MSVESTPALRAYVTGGIVGLVAGLAVGDPAAAIVGTVLLAIGAMGLIGGVGPDVVVSFRDLPISVTEGDNFGFLLDLEARAGARILHLDLGLKGMEVVSVGGARRLDASTISVVQMGEPVVIEVVAVARPWGRASVGPIIVTCDSPMGLFHRRQVAGGFQQISVVPGETSLRGLLHPLETNLHVGDLVSTHRGSGSEFADLRQFRDGDDPRIVNWRVSSRSGDLWVNDRYPERNGDVVLLVDGQVETRTGLETLVDRAVRMAAALLVAHTRQHHRLGLITLDGLCRWIYPGSSEAHRRRLVELLMSVHPGEVLWEAAERAVIRAARRPSLVVVITPLLDNNMATLIHSLHRSGVDLAVVEIEAEPELPPPASEIRALGRRIWALERDRLRRRLIYEGVPTVTWHPSEAASVPIATLDQWRTTWRRHG
jgi:uncharacterized protein (DUF58 family)